MAVKRSWRPWVYIPPKDWRHILRNLPRNRLLKLREIWEKSLNYDEVWSRPARKMRDRELLDIYAEVARRKGESSCAVRHAKRT